MKRVLSIITCVAMLLTSNVFMSLYLALFAGGSMALSVFDIPKIAADWINGLYEEIKGEGVYI